MIVVMEMIEVMVRMISCRCRPRWSPHHDKDCGDGDHRGDGDDSCDDEILADVVPDSHLVMIMINQSIVVMVIIEVLDMIVVMEMIVVMMVMIKYLQTSSPIDTPS